jgi:hypothetical protein
MSLELPAPLLSGATQGIVDGLIGTMHDGTVVRRDGKLDYISTCNKYWVRQY